MKRKIKVQHPDPQKWAGNPRDGEGRDGGVDYIAPLVGQTDPTVADERGTGLGQPCQDPMWNGLPEQIDGEVGRARLNIVWAQGHGHSELGWGLDGVVWERLRREKGRGVSKRGQNKT
jgi:hypothetical protein